MPAATSNTAPLTVVLVHGAFADASGWNGVVERGPYESLRNKMLALDFETQAQEMKAIAGQRDFSLGSVHAVTHDGALLIASASGSQLVSYA